MQTARPWLSHPTMSDRRLGGNIRIFLWPFRTASATRTRRDDRNWPKRSGTAAMLLHGPGTNTANVVRWAFSAQLGRRGGSNHWRSGFLGRAGYPKAFKRGWQNYYGEAWQTAQPSSVDAQWRAQFQTQIFLYRRALQQVSIMCRITTPHLAGG